ncbi:MAG: hypothetical protein JZU47_03420 [Prolixibacteraceae bacterium]|nr:hypothetical protein [Prolixibacteraceae bacterium]
MKILFSLLICLCFLSFRPSTGKTESTIRQGFYIHVQDHTDRTFHKFIVESKDSVDNIFERFFDAELDLGEVDRPITIFNGKRDFYIARVTVFETPDGKKKFKNLKYSSVYVKRAKLKPVTL